MNRPLPFIGKEPPREMLVWDNGSKSKTKRIVVHVNNNGFVFAVNANFDLNDFNPGNLVRWLYCEDISEEKLVPWEFEEVPLDAWYRLKNGASSVGRKIQWFCTNVKYFLIGDFQHNYTTQEMFDVLEYTLDNPLSKTANWHPCGKKVAV